MSDLVTVAHPCDGLPISNLARKLCRKNARYRQVYLEKHAPPVRQSKPQPKAPLEIVEARKPHCEPCEHWKQSSCNKQHWLCRHPDVGAPCTGGKGKCANLHLSHAACPLGHWEAWQPLAEPRRHLLYHVMPILGNGVWQWNLDRLKVRLPLFNGLRLVSIATDHRTDSAAAVKEYLGSGVEYLEFVNDAKLREVQTFVPMLARVQAEAGPEDALFFGHAKGVTKSVNRGVSVHPWATIMYETNLDYWPLVEARLKAHPCVGSFKKVGRVFASAGGWHYSGTFWWIACQALFARNWQRIDRTWWGVEAYPGLHFTAEEAGLLFKEGLVKGLNLYRHGYLRNTIQPEYESWKREHRQFLSLSSVTNLSATG